MEPIRLALIEDDPLLRMGLQGALAGDDRFCWVGAAADGQSGLALIESVRPDVVIVDIGLPDMSGIAITQRLKSTENFGGRVLILTLNHSPEAVLAAFRAGADAYCMKDSAPHLLQEAIVATHGGFAWIDPAIARVVLSHSEATFPDRPPEVSETLPHGLTERELQVLQLIVEGYSNADIGAALFITVGTVKTHVRNILNKLSADDRTQAAVQALRSGLVG